MRHKKQVNVKRLAAVILAAALVVTETPVNAAEVAGGETVEVQAITEEAEVDELSSEQTSTEEAVVEEKAGDEAEAETKAEVKSEAEAETEAEELVTEIITLEEETETVTETETETETETRTQTSVPVPKVNKVTKSTKTSKAANKKKSAATSAQYTDTEAPEKLADGSYSINSLAQFKGFLSDTSTYRGEKLVLNCDIDMEGELAEFDTTFSGTFDGGGHSISNIKVSEGLFKSVRSGAQVSNLHISGVSFEGDNSAGIVTAQNNGTISNVSVIGDLETTYSMERAGAIAGTNSGTIQNCIYYGNITSSEDTKGVEIYVGGIAGTNTGTISSCYAAGSITTSAKYVAGITADNSKTVTNCANYMSIEGEAVIGGVVAGNTGSISGSFNYGNVKAQGANVGGIAGFSEGGSIENCGNYGDISGTENIGGILGIAQSDTTISKCYNLGTLKASSQGLGGILGSGADDCKVAISSCYSTGNLKAGSSADYIGGIAGILKKGTVKDSYVTSSISAEADKYAAAIAGFLGNEEVATYTNTYYLSDIAATPAYREEGAISDSDSPKSEEDLKAIAQSLGTDFASDDDNINGGYPIINGQGAKLYPLVYELNGAGADYYFDITSNAQKPENPTKENNEFKGWYSDKSFSEEYGFGALNSPQIIYAKWEAYTKAQSLELAAKSINLVKGGTYDITVKPTPSDARIPAITWKSSDESVATVDENGKVTAVGNGIATINGNVAEEGVKTSLVLSVTVSDNVIEFINADTGDVITNLDVAVGEDNAANIKLNLVLDADTNSKAKSIQWGSENSNYVKCEGNANSLTGATAKLTGIKSTETGKTITVSAIVMDKSNNPLLTALLTVRVLPLAEDVKIMVGSYNATGMYAFYDIRSRKFVSIGNSVDASKQYNKLTTPVDSITAQITPTDASQKVEWTSDNKDAITINKNTGEIEPNASGTAVITATAKDGSKKSGQVKIVARRMINEFYFSSTADKDEYGRIIVTAGSSITLKANISPSDATVPSLTITPSNSNAVSLNTTNTSGEYTITGKSVTEDTIVKITGVTKDGSYLESSIEVIVKPEVTKINILKDDDTTTSYTGGTIGVNPETDNTKFTLRVKNEPDNASQYATWTSSNAKVATVTVNKDGTCTVEILASGTAKITAKATDGSNISATTTINVAITALAISITGSNSIMKGGTTTLTADVLPAMASNKVEWSSLNKDVATVDSTTGKVTGKKAGIAIIVATASDGSGVTASHTIKVTDAIKTFDIITYDGSGDVVLADEDDNFDEKIVKTGETIGIDPDTFDDDTDPTAKVAVRITPLTASDSVTWKSSNTKVVTVENGVITAVASGKATITATANDGSKKSAKVNVVVATLSKSVEITGSHYVRKGCSIQLTATVGDLSAANKNVEWTSSNPQIASVDSKGKVTAKGGDGMATITAKVADGGATADYDVHVLGGNKDDTVYLTNPDGALSISTSSSTSNAKTASYDMSNSATITLRANFTGGVSEEDGCEKSATWTTSNKNIATVEADENSKTAKVTFLKDGDVTLTATAADGSKSSGKITITVTNEKPKITITGPTQVAVGKKITLVATGGTVETWSSSDESIATVNAKGQVTAKKSGDVTITATPVAADPIKVSYPVKCQPAVTKVEIKAGGKTVSKSAVGIDVVKGYNGGQLDLDAFVTGIVKNEDEDNDENHDKYVTWKSSNTKVATIDEDGKVTPLKTGSVKITATTNDGSGKKATVTVTIGRLVSKITPANNVSDISVANGKSAQLSVTCKPMSATNKNITWESDKPNIVSVSKKGVIKAVNRNVDSNTPVKITATSADGGASCTFDVYVTNPADEVTVGKLGETASREVGVDLDKNGGTVQLEAHVADKNKNVLEKINVTWKSSSTSIATVDENGLVTALKKGKVTITATAGDGTKKSGKVTLYVGKLVSSLTTSADYKESKELQKGKTLDISSWVTAYPMTATYPTLTYTTSDKSIVTVSKKGVITGKKQGTAIVTISTSDGTNLTKTVQIRVW